MRRILEFANKTALAWSKQRLDSCQKEWDIALKAQNVSFSHLSSSVYPSKEKWKLRGKGIVHLVVDSLYLSAREVCRAFFCVFRLLHALGFTLFGIGSKNYKENFKKLWNNFFCSVLRVAYAYPVQLLFNALGCLAQIVSPEEGIKFRNKILWLDLFADYHDIERDLGKARLHELFPKERGEDLF